MIIYKKAQKRDLNSVVRVHRRAFDGFFLTKLGHRFLYKYYELVMDHPAGILYIAVDDDVLGFVAGFSDPVSFYSRMKQKKLSFVLSVIPALCKSPRVIKRLLYDYSEVRSQSRSSESCDNACELSSIGVDPICFGRGIGQGLLDAFIRETRNRGLTAISLVTDANGNESVNKFYLKAGFLLQQSFIQGDRRLMNKYRMELIGDHSS